MIDFIPLESYYPLYINICLFLVLFSLLHTATLELSSSKNIIFINVAGTFLLLFLILYIGLRPINNIFGDTVNYNFSFQKYKMGLPIGDVGDYGWHVFMKTMAQFVTIHVFFTVVSFIYIFPMYQISKSFFGNYWYYSFIMFIVSFSFWTYGVNGMRNGAACSLFLLGLSFKDKKVLMSLMFLLATLFHKTLFLPIFAFLLTYIYNNPKHYLYGWLICIPMSLVAGGIWISLFSSLGFGDDRISGYLTETAASAGSFRWDFLFHSAFAVFAGWYFILRKGFEDKVYYQLFNTYLLCNGFWILVIKANFSNRFAYLSWFMMAIVIIYPLLKKQFFKNQHLVIGKIVLAYFSFTYLMFYLYYN